MGSATRLLVGSVALLWIGGTLALSELRWFGRRPLVERLRPHVPGGSAVRSSAGVLSVQSFRDVVGPAAHALGERAARLFGVGEDLATRLERVHSPFDTAAFRLRQVTWAGVGLVLGVLVAMAIRAPAAPAILFVLGAPLLAFLMVEQQLATTSAGWQRRITLELPVVSEQLGMLLGAGFSLGAALNRLAGRGTGACAQDLARVCGRIRQGLSEVDALREWATVARVDALDRLVGVLALNREAGDLGRLIGDEARSIRRDVQRDLVEQIERRAQQVWIPVTVATLVPGSMLLAVPFMDALRLFSSS
jgi:tight adherence protein C